MVDAPSSAATPDIPRQPGPADDGAAEPAFVSAAEHAQLLAEVKLLANQIDTMRRDIVALGADELVKSVVSVATDELDAVVVHTAQATGTILDVCEILDTIKWPGARELVGAATARIYEACSFQDITGQRVFKVVQTLKSIEAKIAEILHMFGNKSGKAMPPRVIFPSDDVLLHGPQQPGRAMDQCAIDALLNNPE